MASENLKCLDSADFYTVGWIAALSIERAAAEAMLDEEHGAPKNFQPPPNDSNSYTWGRIGEHNIVIASLEEGVYGIASAAATALRMTSTLPSIRVGLLVGIGAGIPRPDDDELDVRLGDVVVSKPDGTTGGVLQYDLVKATPGNRPKRHGFLVPPPHVLLNAVSKIRSVHERKGSKVPSILERMLKENPLMGKQTKKKPGYIHQGFENDRLFPSSYEHNSGKDCASCEATKEIEREARDSLDPEIHYGVIASGSTLVKNGVLRDEIVADAGENCLCLEMEAAGLMNHFPCIVIRGVCDYADSHKNDRWQRYASATAAAYAKELLAYVPLAGVQETKRMSDVLNSVARVTLATKGTLDSLATESHREKIQKWIAAPDPNSNAGHARELRHDGTGSWLLENETFQGWVSGKHKHLWLRGMPGAGKTILSTTIIDYLAKVSDQPVLTFFFDFSDTAKQTKNGLLRSIALQLFQKGLDIEGLVNDLFRLRQDESDKLTTRTLEDLVHAILELRKGVFIVLDALDESSSRVELLSWIKTMFEFDHVRMIYTSREVAELIQGVPKLIGEDCCLSVDREAVDVDIFSYVKETIESDVRFTSKRLDQHEDIKDEINNKVGNGAQGMFRWAACQLDSLAKCMSPRQIREELGRLPGDLSETYERMLENIPKSFSNSAVQLLRFIVHATPPTLQQAIEIIATNIEEEPPHFYIDCRLFDSAEFLHHFTSLVSVVEVRSYRNEATQEIHLAHFSVKEYLKDHPRFRYKDASITITKTCLAYLTDIKGLRWNLQQNFPMARYASLAWFKHAPVAEASEDVSASIVKFLQNRKTFQRWSYCYHDFEEEDLWDSYHELPTGPSLRYACSGGLAVTAKSILHQGANINAGGGSHQNALQAAIYGQNLEIVKLLLEDDDLHIDAEDGTLQEALQLASSLGNIDIVRSLLEMGAEVNPDVSLFKTSPLQAACASSHLEVAKLLLEYNADPNLQGVERGSALSAAARRGDLDIVQLLLSKRVDINACYDFHENALQAAANGGHIKIVQLLLREGADVNVQCGHYGDALKAAIVCRHNDIVKLLLDKGADATAKKGFYGTSLQAAVCGKNQEIVELLLGLELDVNEEGGEYGSALQAASERGYDDIVRLLLSHGANVNAKGGKYGTPLLAACYCGHRSTMDILIASNADVSTLHIVDNYVHLLSMACEGDINMEFFDILAEFEVNFNIPQNTLDYLLETASFFGTVETAQILLDLGADVNAQGFQGYDSSLCTACAEDKQDVIRLLLQSGADINLGGEYSTALRCAASKGQEAVVEMLLDLGADVDAEGPGSATALLAASANGHSGVVRILLENGAGINLVDDLGRTPLFVASSSGQARVVKLLLGRGASPNDASRDSWTPLFVASLNGHLEVLTALLENGAEISATTGDGWTPLLVACSYGHVKIASKLVGVVGADPDHRHFKSSRTALFYAAENGHESVVKLLLADLRVNPDSADHNGRTPLFFASKEGHDVVVGMLLERNTPINLSDRYGATPLSFAARRGHINVVRSLLAAGARSDSRDHFGRTPLLWARHRSHDEVAQLLLTKSGQPDFILDDAMVVNTKPHVPFSRSCAVCTFSIAEDCGYYYCPLCCGGDFDICEDCYGLGARCLEQSHELAFRASGGVEDTDDWSSSENSSDVPYGSGGDAD